MWLDFCCHLLKALEMLLMGNLAVELWLTIGGQNWEFDLIFQNLIVRFVVWHCWIFLCISNFANFIRRCIFFTSAFWLTMANFCWNQPVPKVPANQPVPKMQKVSFFLDISQSPIKLTQGFFKTLFWVYFLGVLGPPDPWWTGQHPITNRLFYPFVSECDIPLHPPLPQQLEWSASPSSI